MLKKYSIFNLSSLAIAVKDLKDLLENFRQIFLDNPPKNNFTKTTEKLLLVN